MSDGNPWPFSIDDELRPVIGTLAHNRAFTAMEVAEYTRFFFDGRTVVSKLLDLGLIAEVGWRLYAPTRRGWEWIEEKY